MRAFIAMLPDLVMRPAIASEFNCHQLPVLVLSRPPGMHVHGLQQRRSPAPVMHEKKMNWRTIWLNTAT